MPSPTAKMGPIISLTDERGNRARVQAGEDKRYRQQIIAFFDYIPPREVKDMLEDAGFRYRTKEKYWVVQNDNPCMSGHPHPVDYCLEVTELVANHIRQANGCEPTTLSFRGGGQGRF